MSTVAKRKTYKEAMLDIRDKYRQAGMRWPAWVRDIATWAVNEGLWKPPVELAITKCTQDMSRALKDEHHTDLQGRKGVRTNVAALLPYLDEDNKEKQGWFWDDIRTASEDHLLAAFKQQREGAISDCKSIQRQIDSANDNNPNLAGRPIKMLWDLTDEVAEVLDDVDDSPDPKKPR